MGGRWGRNMGVGGRIMPPPKDVYILIPGTCEYGPLHGQRDFADVIKLRISNGEIILDFLGELQP